MEKNQIIKIYGEDYKEMTKQLLEAADLIGRLPDKNCPDRNQAEPRRADTGVSRGNDASGGGFWNHRVSAGARLPESYDCGGLMGWRLHSGGDGGLRIL